MLYRPAQRISSEIIGYTSFLDFVAAVGNTKDRNSNADFVSASRMGYVSAGQTVA